MLIRLIKLGETLRPETLIFRPNWGPKDPKKNILKTSPLSQSLDDRILLLLPAPPPPPFRHWPLTAPSSLYQCCPAYQETCEDQICLKERNIFNSFKLDSSLSNIFKAADSTRRSGKSNIRFHGLISDTCLRRCVAKFSQIRKLQSAVKLRKT